MTSKVVDNKDESRQGRVQVENGQWLSPIACGSGLFDIPPIGSEVVIYENYYIAYSPDA